MDQNQSPQQIERTKFIDFARSYMKDLKDISNLIHGMKTTNLLSLYLTRSIYREYNLLSKLVSSIGDEKLCSELNSEIDAEVFTWNDATLKIIHQENILKEDVAELQRKRMWKTDAMRAKTNSLDSMTTLKKYCDDLQTENKEFKDLLANIYFVPMTKPDLNDLKQTAQISTEPTEKPVIESYNRDEFIQNLFKNSQNAYGRQRTKLEEREKILRHCKEHGEKISLKEAIGMLFPNNPSGYNHAYSLVYTMWQFEKLLRKIGQVYFITEKGKEVLASIDRYDIEHNKLVSS